MKKVLLILIPFALVAATFIDVLDELGINQKKAQEFLVSSITNGYLTANYDVVKKARALSVDMRVQATRELMKMAKEYTASEQFKSDYKKWRYNKLNPGEKTRLGLPKLGQMINNKIDNALDKEKNEKLYPADANEMVKQRLQEFLDISKTVDFDAELQGSMFKNPAYERKSPQWKMCYRAGKEVVEAAREEADKWLKELP